MSVTWKHLNLLLYILYYISINHGSNKLLHRIDTLFSEANGKKCEKEKIINNKKWQI